MSFTNAQVKALFETRIDENFSSYFSNDELDRFFNAAVENVMTAKIEQFQRDSKITVDLMPLLKTSTLTSVTTPPITSNTVDLTNATLGFKYPISVLVTFTGSSVQRTADPLYYVERGDPFSVGTTRNPLYRIANSTLIVEPVATAITSMEFTYFKTPLVADRTAFAFATTATISAYSDKVIQEITTEAIRLASENMRDQAMYQMSSVDRVTDQK
jgi:hypothetical protein